MNKQRFQKKFLEASTSSAAAALLNMLTTVLVVRFLGDYVYADYVIDLAFVSIVLIILELIPSNYVIFKVQDNNKWVNSSATQTVVSVFLVVLVISFVGVNLSIFKNYTPWITAYAALLTIKRFIDIRQQSTGNIGKFLKLEFFIAVLRIVIFWVCIQNKLDPLTTVWISIVLATAIVQIVWFFSHPEDRHPFKYCLTPESIKLILDERSNYPSYYIGIILKRIKDNLIPLAADRFFQSKEDLAVFFLAYRGLLFASSQIRIFEGILNHRASMNIFISQLASKKILISGCTQIIAFVASMGILLISGLSDINFTLIFLISLIVWPTTYMVINRAQAYSKYKANYINASIFGYILSMIIICIGLIFLDFRTETYFALALVGAECISLLIIYICSKKNHD